MEDVVEDMLPWPLVITTHALEQARNRFNLRSDAEAEAFIREQLGNSTSTRKRRDGALRWTTEAAQLVTVQKETGVWVVTCYPRPKQREWTKKRKVTWRSERRNQEESA